MLGLVRHWWTGYASLFSSKMGQFGLQLQDPPFQFDTVGAEGGGGFFTALVLLLFLFLLQIGNI